MVHQRHSGKSKRPRSYPQVDALPTAKIERAVPCEGALSSWYLMLEVPRSFREKCWHFAVTLQKKHMPVNTT
jgi:hypothetical protein